MSASRTVVVVRAAVLDGTTGSLVGCRPVDGTRGCPADVLVVHTGG